MQGTTCAAEWMHIQRPMDAAHRPLWAVRSQVPLQPREVRLLGPKAGGPLSDYHNVQLHAVELARSENTCRNNNQCQKCLNIRGLDLGDGISVGSTQSVSYIPLSTMLGPQSSPPISKVIFILCSLTRTSHNLGDLWWSSKCLFCYHGRGLLQGNQPHTFPAASGDALFCSRRLATSSFPYFAATWRGVNPFWKEKT